MTDRREPPALGLDAPDRDEPPDGRRQARRLALRVALGTAALLPIAWVAGRLVDSIDLGDGRRLAFADIELAPAPPPCYRPGAKGLLAQVGKLYGEETLPALRVDLDKLAGAFRLHPWVKRVARIERAYPNRLIVALDYRRPVARIDQRSDSTVVDDQAHVLPSDEVDPGEPLVPVRGLKPSEALAGRLLKVEGDAGRRAPDEVPRAVARLAGFLKEKMTGPNSIPFRFDGIELTRQPGQGSFDLWVGIPPNLWVYWRRIPGEGPDAPGDSENWAALIDWMRHPTEPVADDPKVDWLLWLRKTGAVAERAARRRADPSGS